MFPNPISTNSESLGFYITCKCDVVEGLWQSAVNSRTIVRMWSQKAWLPKQILYMTESNIPAWIAEGLRRHNWTAIAAHGGRVSFSQEYSPSRLFIFQWMVLHSCVCEQHKFNSVDFKEKRRGYERRGNGGGVWEELERESRDGCDQNALDTSMKLSKKLRNVLKQ